MNYKKYLIIGIPVLFIIGSIFHYIYEWSGNNFFVSLISPVNESIWEHLKLVLLPMTLYWAIFKLFNTNVSTDKWFFSLFISLIASMLSITIFYYTYTGAFGMELLSLDIFSLFLGISIGHILGIHFYKYAISIPTSISVILILALFVVFGIFTIYPPNLPIFLSV